MIMVPVVGAGGCAARGFRPPTGVGEPAPEASDALAEAVNRCLGVRSFTASTRLSGAVGGDSLGSIGLDIGLTSDGGIGLEARAVMTTRLWLSGRQDRATLYLADEDAALVEPADEIVEALIGVKLVPGQLLAIMTGCVVRDPTMAGAERFGNVLTVTTPDGVLYLQREVGRWRIVAGSVDGLTVSYDRLGPSFPQEFGIRSEAGRAPEVDLTIRIVQGGSVNADIPPSAFARLAPPGARRITLDELRAAGPLKSQGGG